MAGVGPAQLGAKVQRNRVAPVPVNPTITSTAQSGNEFIAVVKKSYTAPSRIPMLLKTDARFRRSGTLNRIVTVTPTSGDIRFFRAATPGVEITFNGTDNVFSGNQLSAGVRILAEARGVSSGLNDVQLTLTLAAGSTPVGPPASVTLTAVLLTLNISASRPAPGVAPPPLAQPPPVAPPAGANDKWFGGRLISAQDAGNTQERALLTVGPVLPTAFAGTLVLRQVTVSGTTVGALSNKAQVFDGTNEVPTPGEVAKNNPHEINTNVTPIPAGGLQFWVQGRTVSARARDTGFQLGIKNVENDGDRVAVTVGIAAIITLATRTIVVKKTYTNPARQAVTLRTGSPFTRSGTLQRSSNAIRLFTAATAGTEITFNGADNVFTGARLTAPAGVQLFAEGSVASGAVDDFQLTLTLAAGAAPPAGSPLTAKMTAVQLTLDIFMSRTANGVAPASLPQPPAVAPAAGTVANDKWFGGRFVHVQDPGNHHGRAMISVGQVQPMAFNGTLVLRQVAVSAANDITGLDVRARVFDNEFRPPAGDAAKANPHEIDTNVTPIPAVGLQFFVEGANVSAAVRDTGFQLGIKDIENDGDRINLTIVQFSLITATIKATPPNTLLNSTVSGTPLPANHVYQNASISEDFAVNLPLVLMRNGQPNIILEVTCAPAGLPIKWKAIRNRFDHLSLGTANDLPTVIRNAGNFQKATLSANQKGSFRIRAFIDTNGTDLFEENEPSIPLNLVLADATMVADNSAAHTGAPFLSATFGAGGNFRVANGSWSSGLAGAGMAMEIVADVTGGGPDGLLGLQAPNRVFAGLVNMVQIRDVIGTYRDSTVTPPRIHLLKFIAASNAAGLPTQHGGRPLFRPAASGDPAPILFTLPLLDSGRTPAVGVGGDTATMSNSGPHTSVNRPVGQQWTIQCIDSPGFTFVRTHPVNASAILSQAHYHYQFIACFCFWTNINGNRGNTNDPAERVYSVLRKFDWGIVGDWNISYPVAPGAPVANAVTAHNISIGTRTTINPIGRAEDNAVEVRPPSGIQIAAFDGSG